jgi:dolichyl-phosphate-mannose--protein O-mannosyl transferase
MSPRRVTTFVLGVLLAAGLLLRLVDLGVLPRLGFDEDHFVLAARAYLAGEADRNNHPPLGKIFIAVGMLLLGDDPTGWRAAAVVWGLQTIVVAGVLARELFEDRRAGWLAAAFVAADGFFLTYSRAALLDGSLACFVLWSVLAAACARSWRGVLASAVLVGLAASVKWSGGFAVFPAAATVLAQRRVRPRAVLLFALAPVVHLALWTGALAFTGEAAGPRALVEVMRAALRSHVDNGRLTHAVGSQWYSWPLFLRPIVLKDGAHGVWHHYASTVGHPLLFLGGTLAALGTIAGGVAAAWSPRFRALARTAPVARPAALLVVGWLALLAPWVNRSYTFLYHYLPAYGFVLVLLAGVVARLERRHPVGVALFLVAVFLVFVFYAPVWAELAIGEQAARLRLFFPGWRP